jgi:glycosyltransferase involved in cell wall biosynthesis
MPTVRTDIQTFELRPSTRYWEFDGVPMLAFNDEAYRQARECMGRVRPAFVYQRYSAYNLTGLRLASDFAVPLVLEYNGSEIWVNRNWGKPLPHEDLAERIELANLRTAEVVVVVSAPMRDELLQRGVEPGRILVNPNGVDPHRYSPDVDGADVRQRLGLEGKFVVGFIGTFGRWQGADLLVEAFSQVIERRPELRGDLRLLLVGDGQTMPLVRERIRETGIGDLVRLTGLVPHEQGPAHLAACDIFASPHVPNADGSRFFGSPTKLFEYMAMGRGIVASDLDQIGEVLEHKRTAWLVEPGSSPALADGILALVDDPAMVAALGAAAREAAVREHTWSAHTRRIVEALGAVGT